MQFCAANTRYGIEEEIARQRGGGCEGYAIKIIETAGRILDQTLVNTDPFGGNLCTDEKCEPIGNPKNKISCRRSCICYRVTCILCLKAGRLTDVTNNLATMVSQQSTCTEERKNTSLNSKSGKIQAESAFFKHLMSCLGGKSDNKSISDYLEIQIIMAYKKPFTILVEEGTHISTHKLLNSENE